MKRFFASLATLSLIGTIGRHPAIAGTMMLLGVGGAAVISNLTTPTLTPFISSNFNPNQPIGGTSFTSTINPSSGTFTAKIDNGSGGSGTILNVTAITGPGTTTLPTTAVGWPRATSHDAGRVLIPLAFRFNEKW